MDTTLKATSQCVLCGLCLPHCPTYLKTQDEADSPRGRISLMQALDTGKLEYSAKMQKHLDGCLTCRSCESVCPANVPYGNLIASVRHRIQEIAPESKTRLLDSFVQHRWMRNLAGILAELYLVTGTQTILRKFKILRLLGLSRQDSLVQRPYGNSIVHSNKVSITANKQIGLFTGCVAEVFDRETLNACKSILELSGCDVSIPSGQTCCGALHHHRGDLETAEAFAKQNWQSFDSSSLNAIVSCATGCGSQLDEYAEHYQDQQARNFSAKHHDICAYLSEADRLQNLNFAALYKSVAIHIPCTQRNVLKQAAITKRLLTKIPDIKLTELETPALCCGAAGSYMLTHSDMADSLLHDVLQVLDDSGAEILVTANIGCAMHIRAGLEQRGRSTEVIHPVTLLYRQLLKS